MYAPEGLSTPFLDVEISILKMFLFIYNFSELFFEFCQVLLEYNSILFFCIYYEKCK